jgi:hypothetical protein
LTKANVRLADFIRDNHEVILKEWETFARTLKPAAEGLGKVGLRDHADEILTAIVADMNALESASEKSAKSKGHATHGDKAIRDIPEDSASFTRTFASRLGSRSPKLWLNTGRFAPASFVSGPSRTPTRMESSGSTKPSTQPSRRPWTVSRRGPTSTGTNSLELDGHGQADSAFEA